MMNYRITVGILSIVLTLVILCIIPVHLVGYYKSPIDNCMCDSEHFIRIDQGYLTEYATRHDAGVVWGLLKETSMGEYDLSFQTDEVPPIKVSSYVWGMRIYGSTGAATYHRRVFSFSDYSDFARSSQIKDYDLSGTDFKIITRDNNYNILKVEIRNKKGRDKGDEKGEGN